MKKCLKSVLLIIMFACICAIGIVNETFAEDDESVVKVGYYDIEGFQHTDEMGNVSGFNMEVLRIIAIESGWNFRYVKYDSLNETLEALKNKEIDLMAPCIMSDEYKEYFEFCDYELETEYTTLITRKDEENLYYEDYEGFEGIKVAVIDKHPTTEYFIDYMENNAFNVELVYVKDADELIKALDSKEVDAAVNTLMMTDDDKYKIIARFTPVPYYYITWKGNNEFIVNLNKVMRDVRNNYPRLLEKLHSQYFDTKFCQYYSKEDLEFINSLGTLKVAYVSERRPLSFKNESTGQLDGISRRIFDKVSEISGLKFEYVEMSSGDITYNFLVENHIDLISGVEYNTTNLNSQNILISSTYLESKKILISGNDTEYVRGKNYTVAIPKGLQTIRKLFEESYPELEILNYDNVEECFRAVKKGEADFTLQNQYVAEYYMANPKYEKLKAVSMEGLEDRFCFSAVINNAESKTRAAKVISIINVALSQIKDSEIQNIIVEETIKHQYKYKISDIAYKYRAVIAIFSVMLTAMVGILFYANYIKKKGMAIRKQEEEKLVLQQRRYRMVLDNSDDMIYEIRLDGNFCIISDKIREKFGWDIPKQIDDFTIEKFVEILRMHPKDTNDFKNTIKGVTADNGGNEIIVRMMRQDGVYIWCRITRMPLMDNDNRLVSVVGKIVDVDEEIREKEFLRMQSRTDRLTGLLLKQIFEENVKTYLEKNLCYSTCFVFIDMDHFKDVNDKLGHTIGDEAIKDTAEKIKVAFKKFDLITRFGGDEFCAFSKNIQKEDMYDIVGRAKNILMGNYTDGEKEVTITASIGVAYCLKNKTDYDTLFMAADKATYEVKENGRNGFSITEI